MDQGPTRVSFARPWDHDAASTIIVPLTRALRKVFVTTTDAMVLESTVEGPERGLCGAGQAG